VAQHYSRRANRAKKLTGVVRDFELEIERRKATFKDKNVQPL